MNQKIIVDFMHEHFDEVVGDKLLSWKLIDFGDTHIRGFSENETKRFLQYLMDSLFSKIRTKEQVNAIHAELLERIFGNVKGKIVPIDFLYELFGKILGEEILKLAKIEFKEPAIEDSDDISQLRFLKMIIQKLFGFSKKYYEEVISRMLLFMSSGPRQGKISDLLKNDRKAYAKVLELIIDWVEELDKKELERILFIVEQMKTQVYRIKKQTKTAEAKKNPDLEPIFEEYLGQNTKVFLDLEKQKYGIYDLDEIDRYELKAIVEDFFNLEEISNFSAQKKRYIMSKLKV